MSSTQAFLYNQIKSVSLFATNIPSSTWEAPLQLSKRGEKTGAVSLQLPVLSGDAELDGEPVAGGQLLDVLVGGAQGGEPDLLGELGEGRVGEERHMTKQLMTNILECVSYDILSWFS